ncbi:MAG: HEAT repeat domain-containing protein [Phycisphaerae bacterium]
MNSQKKIRVLLPFLLLAMGCSQAPVAPRAGERELTERSRATLINFTHAESPLLRSHALEALADSDQASAGKIILEGLNDNYWGVRFTACMAIMKLKYAPAKPLLVKAMNDPNLSVQAAAAGTLHVLGDQRFTSRLGQMLFDKNPIVRRNAATVLGRMGDPGAVKLLRSALRDDDISLKLQVLEAMTLLGNSRAIRLMINYCRSVYDDECILAMLTLAQARSNEALDQITYVYETSSSQDRLGMRLVAARALAMMGDNRGRNVALSSLQYYTGRLGQAATIRTLAAMALGEMKDKTTLGALEQALSDQDPDVQIIAASAILKTVQTNLPF